MGGSHDGGHVRVGVGVGVGVGGCVGVGAGVGVGVGRGAGRGVGVGWGAGGTAAATLVAAPRDRDGLELAAGDGARDVEASECHTAHATSPQYAAVCVRARAGADWCSARNAPEPPMTISPAAHGAAYRTRKENREFGRPATAGPVAEDGSLAPLDRPVGIRPLPWTAKCYQIAVAITDRFKKHFF